MFSVLHVAETLRGGTASYMQELIPAQRKLIGEQNLSFILPRGNVADVDAADGLDVHIFDDDCSRALRVWRIARLVREVLRRNKPDIIHAHGTFAGVAVRLSLRGLAFPPKVVYCAHGWAFDRVSSDLKNSAIAWVERLLSGWTDRIICISDHDYRSALNRGLPKDKLIAIHNGIADLAPGLADIDWPGDGRRFLFVGRFDRQKAVDVLIDAMRELDGSATAVLVGAGVLEDFSEEQMPRNVFKAGWQPRNEVMKYVQAAEVLIVPSRWEGFGLSALEGMRAGKAVIASRVGGLQELVDDGVTGLLVEPGSKPALVQAMQRILKEDISRMGALARQRYLDGYTADRMNGAILDLYRSLTGGVDNQ